MNKYERKLLKLQQQQDIELEYLDSQRHSMNDSEYWQEVSKVYKKYSELVAEVDSERRSSEAIIAAREGTHFNIRPEMRYSDVLSQLRGRKETELLFKLSQISSSNYNDVPFSVAVKDPFYMDKLDPMAVFKRWWDSYVSTFPSVSDVELMLKRVDVDEEGVLVFKEEEKAIDYHELDENSIDTSIIREDIFCSRKKTRSARKELAEIQDRTARIRSPLASRLVKEKDGKLKDNALSCLLPILGAYELPPETYDLLREHLTKVAIPKGLTKVDEYKPMLEQFFRNVPEDMRNAKIREAISRRWRKLIYD